MTKESYDESYDEIEKVTFETLKNIHFLSKNESSDNILMIHHIIKSWYSKYGTFYETLKMNKKIKNKKMKDIINPANVCKTCGSKIEKILPGTGIHKYKVICENGHFKQWR